MLSKVMRYCNNYFWTKICQVTLVSFDSDNNTISSADIAEGDFLVGQYVRVSETILNNEVYKVTAQESGSITVDGTLYSESGVNCKIWGLSVPNDFIELVSNITSYNSKITTLKGVTNWSEGNLSKSYDKKSGTWESVFSIELSDYRKLRW